MLSGHEGLVLCSKNMRFTLSTLNCTFVEKELLAVYAVVIYGQWDLQGAIQNSFMSNKVSEIPSLNFLAIIGTIWRPTQLQCI